MKLFRYIIVVALILLLASPVFGAVGVREDGTYSGEATYLDIYGAEVTFSGDEATITVGGERSIPLSLSMFLVQKNATAETPCAITSSTKPALTRRSASVDTYTGTSACWADGETTPIQVTFQVPQNYYSGGAFRILTNRKGADLATTAVKVDYSIYVNTDDAVNGWATTASDYDPVSCTGNASTPVQVTLTCTASLSAGSWVTLNIWRDDASAVIKSDLELYYVEFYYTARD